MVDPLRTPPRFVPTLTAVVDMPSAMQGISMGVIGTPWTPSQGLTVLDVEFAHEQLLHRVLQRIDLTLEKRLGDAISSAVKQQLDTMLARLREEIEGALRASIAEALARELSENTGSVPTRTHQGLG